MNILVVGGAGAIGALAVRELVELGHHPVVYSRNPTTQRMPDLAGQVTLASGDIQDYGRLVSVIREHSIERIMHMAAVVVMQAEPNPPLAVDSNVAGSVRLLQAARETGIRRVVFASSKRAFGRLRCRHGEPRFDPISESHPTNPATVYGHCKVATELFGKWYRQRHGLEFTALRFPTTWGPGRGTQHRGYTSFVGNLVEAALEGKPIDLEFSPDLVDDFSYNADNAHALVLACLVERKPSWIYHIGHGRTYRLQEVVEAVQRVYPDARVDYLPLHPTDNPAHSTVVMDITRARRELGYQPRYSLEEAIRHCGETTLNIWGRR